MGMTYKRGAVWWVKYYRNGRPIRESSHSSKESDAINLLKLREGDIAHGLPVNPKLNRIRFDEAADDLKTEYAVNGRRSADELERRIRLHLLPYFGGRRLSSITTADVNAFILKRQKEVMVIGQDAEREERRYSKGEINRDPNVYRTSETVKDGGFKLYKNVSTSIFVQSDHARLSQLIRSVAQKLHREEACV